MPLSTLSCLDHLAIIMISLVVCIGSSILIFSHRYMQGDAHYKSFCFKIILLILSLCLMVSADNIVLLLLTWGISNFLLVTLIIHKTCWKASWNSGLVAAKNFSLGFIALAMGLCLLYQASGETSLSKISQLHSLSPFFPIAAVFILIAAMTQSAIWPFHRWLLSSLNAPTPVSAIMHAGLVNGGGFLLARFAFLCVQSPSLLTLIFIFGVITALYGTLWKLMQPDIKKMLACSTVGQMGFMLAQCGLGLFAAAITHLCWHGFFKAYLFLNSPSAAQEKKSLPPHPIKWSAILFSLLGGACGTSAFVIAGGNNFSFHNSTLVLMSVAFITASQVSLSFVEIGSLKRVLLMFPLSWLLGACYGLNFRLVEAFLAPLHLFKPQPLNLFYLLGMLCLVGSWIAHLYYRHYSSKNFSAHWYLKSYVSMINASQAHPSTITAHRNDYQYKELVK